MPVNDEELRRAGFTESDLQKLKINLSKSGLTMDELITGLSNRFRAACGITTVFVPLLILLMAFGTRTNAISAAIGALFVLLIVWLPFPVKLARKAWAFRKTTARKTS